MLTDVTSLCSTLLSVALDEARDDENHLRDELRRSGISARQLDALSHTFQCDTESRMGCDIPVTYIVCACCDDVLVLALSVGDYRRVG